MTLLERWHRAVDRVTGWRQRWFPHEPAPIERCDWHRGTTATWVSLQHHGRDYYACDRCRITLGSTAWGWQPIKRPKP